MAAAISLPTGSATMSGAFSSAHTVFPIPPARVTTPHRSAIASTSSSPRPPVSSSLGARTSGVHQYGSVLGDSYRGQIELEAICDTVRTYEVQLIPGLLQTSEYGRAVTVASRAWKTPEEIDQFVQVRLARQQRLTDENPMSLWAVLAEGVLRQHVGGSAVTQAQLEHLTTMAELPC
jgi:hypothetical protein